MGFSPPQRLAAAALTSAATIAFGQACQPSWRAANAGITPYPSGGDARAFAVFDDGNGPSLYVLVRNGGGPPVYRWTGIAWQPVGGLIGFVESVAAINEGPARGLYVGGY